MLHAARTLHNSAEYAKCAKLPIIKYQTENNARTDAACNQRCARFSQAKCEKLTKIINVLVVHQLS